MSYHQRPRRLRLAISSEAEALFSDFGGDAYAEACRRSRDASSYSLEGLERCRGDDRSPVKQAVISARRLILLKRRTLIRPRRGLGEAELLKRQGGFRAARFRLLACATPPSSVVTRMRDIGIEVISRG